MSSPERHQLLPVFCTIICRGVQRLWSHPPQLVPGKNNASNLDYGIHHVANQEEKRSVSTTAQTNTQNKNESSPIQMRNHHQCPRRLWRQRTRIVSSSRYQWKAMKLNGIVFHPRDLLNQDLSPLWYQRMACSRYLVQLCVGNCISHPEKVFAIQSILLWSDLKSKNSLNNNSKMACRILHTSMLYKYMKEVWHPIKHSALLSIKPFKPSKLNAKYMKLHVFFLSNVEARPAAFVCAARRGYSPPQPRATAPATPTCGDSRHIEFT